MKCWKLIWLVVVGSGLFVCRLGKCEEPRELVAPKATQIPIRLESFGRLRVDNYYWLRDRANPKVVAYLDAENDYTDMVMAHTKSLQKTLFDEIVVRIKQSDSTAPVYDNGYYYYSRFQAGKQYPILVRKKGSLEAVEEILIDENELAQGHGYFSLGASHVSPDNRLDAFAVDTGGRRFYSIRVKELATGRMLDETIADVTVSVGTGTRTASCSRRRIRSPTSSHAPST